MKLHLFLLLWIFLFILADETAPDEKPVTTDADKKNPFTKRFKRTQQKPATGMGPAGKGFKKKPFSRGSPFDQRMPKGARPDPNRKKPDNRPKGGRRRAGAPDFSKRGPPPPLPPKGRSRPPKNRANMAKFGPCQACYAVVASIDLAIISLPKSEKAAYDFKSHCHNKAEDYKVLFPARGGNPIVQGPGLPDLSRKIGDDAVESDLKVKKRFVKDFHKVCSVTTKDKKKMVHTFQVPNKVNNKEKEMKWKGGIRRNLCSRFCPSAYKSEL